MLKIFSPRPKAVRSQVAVTLASELQVHTQTVRQTQFATEHYVLTQLDRQFILFRADRGERFVVDREARQLKRIDVSAQLAQIEQVRGVVGEVHVTRDDAGEEVDGRRCRLVSFENTSSQIALSGESHIARVAGLGETALRHERELDRSTQLFMVEMAPDEVIVRSALRILSAGMEQNQRVRLLDVAEGVEGLDEFDEMLAWKTVG